MAHQQKHATHRQQKLIYGNKSHTYGKSHKRKKINGQKNIWTKKIAALGE